MVAKISSMMPAMRTRPSTMDSDGLSVLRTPEIEHDAADDHGDQDKRNRAQEEFVAVNGDRCQQRIFRDLAEDDSDHEWRARPIVALEHVAKRAHEEDQDQILP